MRKGWWFSATAGKSADTTLAIQASGAVKPSQAQSNPVKPLPPGTQRVVGVLEYRLFPSRHHSITPFRSSTTPSLHNSTPACLHARFGLCKMTIALDSDLSKIKLKCRFQNSE
jgi:hypothetical protein